MNKDKAKDRHRASALNDPLTDLLKTGDRALIQQAGEAKLIAAKPYYTDQLQNRLNRNHENH